MAEGRLEARATSGLPMSVSDTKTQSSTRSLRERFRRASELVNRWVDRMISRAKQNLFVLLAIPYFGLAIGCAPSQSESFSGTKETTVRAAERVPANAKADPGPTVWYVERIHDLSGLKFADFVVTLLQSVRPSINGSESQVVFWPNLEDETIVRLDLPTIQDHLRDDDLSPFTKGLHGRIGTPDEEGFIAGLRFCDEWASKHHGNVVIVGDGPTGIATKSLRVMKQVSSQRALSAIVYRDGDDDPDAWKSALSGFLVTVASLGN